MPQPASVSGAAPQLLSPDQLDNIVAPIALYPDPLLGQILAASTYPLELVEAQQWLQQNGNLRGQALTEAARQQGWDPSVQVLVAFPDAVALLNRDVRWTTDLGNAFLTQQADVMNAIQALRVQAQNNGRLATTPQQVVSTDTQNGQSAVTIEPANPQVIYPPIYSPQAVWGPPVSGAYPAFSSAPYGSGYYGGYGAGGYGSSGYGFGAGINIAGLFSSALNWGGWGWVLGWFTHSLSLASLFFNVLGFHGFGGGYGGGYGAGGAALTAWSHNPAHRLGVAYPRGFVAARNSGAFAAARVNSSRSMGSTAVAGRSEAWQGFNRGAASTPQRMASVPQSNAFRSAPEISRGTPYASQAFRNTTGTVKSYAPQASTSRYLSQSPASRYSESRAPMARYTAPQMASSHYSAPKFSAPHGSGHISTPHYSAPKQSGGGHSGKSSHKH